MKVKFAIEKSMYSNLLMELMSGKEDINIAEILIKMKTLEEVIQAYGDEIITVVSTKLTYDGTKTAPPMKIGDKGEEIVVEEPENWNKEKVEAAIVDGVVIAPSPPCEHCRHKMISHNRKGCRFCDCKETRKRK